MLDDTAANYVGDAEMKDLVSLAGTDFTNCV